MLWNILNVHLLLEVSPLILYVCVLWSKGLLVPFLPYFCFKVREMPTIIEYSLSCLYQRFSPSPHRLFFFLVHTSTNTQLDIYSHTHQLINSYTLMQTQPHTQCLFIFLHYFSVCILFLSWKHIQKVTLTLVLSRFKLLPLFLSINIRHFSTFYRLSSLNVLFRFLLLISRYTFSFKKNCFYFHSNE